MLPNIIAHVFVAVHFAIQNRASTTASVAAGGKQLQVENKKLLDYCRLLFLITLFYRIFIALPVTFHNSTCHEVIDSRY